MTDQLDRRADLTRLQIIQAASRQFARRPYSLVSLDDILTDAEVTKGAMYFHFRSKHALATAIVEHQSDTGRTTVDGLTAQGLSGLETMIDVVFQAAIDDLTNDMARAALNLLESIGRTDGLQERVLNQWASTLAGIARRAISDGDITGHKPEDIARFLLSMHLGLRHTSVIDKPDVFLDDLRTAWLMALPGFAAPDRLGFLTTFIERRTALAVKKAALAQRDAL
ncbi:TetR family transcriptional regulator [Micromonospora sp. WMMD736]|uniref:TetR family transcriptional regulator n=1 Tax=Micromonospora sp. WMMD736 TaxID=3404112 RepID=UPI003B947DAF